VSLVVLDTDVASFSLRNRLSDQLRAALAGHTMCITFVTVGELMKWRAYDEAVADKWGQLQARAQRRGRPRPQNDTWIAACCLVDDLPLATLNIKDFADFAEHEGLTLIGGQGP
jgi:toxin FitB